MPEGDSIHRAAARVNAALAGRAIEVAEAPDPRSPIHHRAAELRGRTLLEAEARGKHLLAHFSGDLVVHSHLGVNGRWLISGAGRVPVGRHWLVIGSARAVAAQSRGKLLRLVSESRARNDPGLMQMGPDPLRPGFDTRAAALRVREMAAGAEVGEALLDQTVIAGIGNAIRAEACFAARTSPWRRVRDLSVDDLERIIRSAEQVMRVSMERGRRPRSVYGAAGRPCPRCGTPIRSRGQGDANRIAYWCPRCQE